MNVYENRKCKICDGVYDATTKTNFLPDKSQQIENYLNQLKKEKININRNNYTIKDVQKQVWIVSRGEAVTHIATGNHIKIKEIPYTKLIEIYDKRMNADIGISELYDLLIDLK